MSRTRPSDELALLEECEQLLKKELCRFDILRWSLARNVEVPVLELTDAIDDISYRLGLQADGLHRLVETYSHRLLQESGVRI